MGNFAGFGSVQLQKPKRSEFDLSHDKRLTTRMGRLTPVLITECVPSDSFRGGSEVLMRLAPLLAPIYDRIELYVHYFFVPNRLLWADWEEFITGGRLGVGVDPATAPIPPFIDLGNVMAIETAKFGKGSLFDYLGAPMFLTIDPTPANWNGRTVDVMPLAAYQLVWYEYFRDRNFVSDDNSFPLTSGEQSPGFATGTLMTLRNRNYAHDYFTSALPFTQRGVDVMVPLSFSATDINYMPATFLYGQDGLPLAGGGSTAYGTTVGGETIFGGPSITNEPAQVRNIESISADSGDITINDLRSAMSLQVWLERNAIGGSRYTESTQAHFGVKPQDSRLQRPEYIGGGRIPVQISEVVAQSWSTDGSANIPQGNLAGHGITYGNTNRFNYYCTEHGFIIGIASLLAPASYQQGLPRMFRRRSFLDYPWPTFAKLGEQEVSNYEIYCNPAALLEDADGDVPLFGYQSRYADWKYICNTNAGEFRDTYLFWTLTRVFDTAPELSEAFNLFDSTTEDRIFPVNTAQNFLLYVHNRVSVRRPLPYFGTPNTFGFN